MTQIFDEEGRVHPVTLLNATPAVVIQVKNKEKDGYNALQIGFGSRRLKLINKPEQGHLKGLGNFRHLREVRISDKEVLNFKAGDKIDLSSFSINDLVSASAISKGKGFQGVVKRHGFRGGPRTHGQKHSEREAGSIGGGGRAGGRVAKGMRMAGRMGGERITVKNLRIAGVYQSENRLLLEGAVPGRKGTLIEILGK